VKDVYYMMIVHHEILACDQFIVAYRQTVSLDRSEVMGAKLMIMFVFVDP